MALDADFGARLRLFHFQRGAENFAEQRLDRLVAERAFVGAFQRGQHLGFARRIVVRDAHRRMQLANFADGFGAPRQQFENLHVDLIDLPT